MKSNMIFILIAEFTAAFFAAFVFGIAFYLLQGRNLKQRQFAALCVLIFLGTWAGGIWVRPFGPVYGGIYWLPFLLTGIIFSIIIFLFFRKTPPHGRRETIEMLDKMRQERKLKRIAETSMTFYLRFLFVFLTAAIIFRYIFKK